jgi:hypothetical protein
MKNEIIILPAIFPIRKFTILLKNSKIRRIRWHSKTPNQSFLSLRMAPRVFFAIFSRNQKFWNLDTNLSRPGQIKIWIQFLYFQLWGARKRFFSCHFRYTMNFLFIFWHITNNHTRNQLYLSIIATLEYLSRCLVYSFWYAKHARAFRSQIGLHFFY